jgi:hypothetical protein
MTAMDVWTHRGGLRPANDLPVLTTDFASSSQAVPMGLPGDIPLA